MKEHMIDATNILIEESFKIASSNPTIVGTANHITSRTKGWLFLAIQ